MLGIDKERVREFSELAFPILFESTSYLKSMKLFLDKEDDVLLALNSAYEALARLDTVFDLAEEYGIITADSILAENGIKENGIEGE